MIEQSIQSTISELEIRPKDTHNQFGSLHYCLQPIPPLNYKFNVSSGSPLASPNYLKILFVSLTLLFLLLPKFLLKYTIVFFVVKNKNRRKIRFYIMGFFFELCAIIIML